MTMCDIHTHIIPLVDDGSSSIEESIELIKMEIKNGVTKIVCTPHQRDDFFNKYLHFFEVKRPLILDELIEINPPYSLIIT